MANTFIATLTGDTFIPSAALKTIVYVGGQVGGRAGNTATSNVNFALTGGIDTLPRAGDLVIITVTVGSAGRTTACAITTPAGYTAYGQLNADGTSADTSMDVSRKVMGGTPDTAFTLPSSGDVNDAQRYTVQVFRNVAATPDDVTSTTATGTGTARANPAQITPVTAGAVVVICGAGATAAVAAVYVAPANFVTNFLTGLSTDTTDAMVGSGYMTGWTSGAVDPAVYTGGTTNAADSWAARTIALRPALGTGFEDIRANIRDGLTSAQSEATGWNATVRPNIPLANIVRTSDTVCTITLQAQADYDITADETITWTIPAVALTGGVALVATPTVPIVAAGIGTSGVLNQTLAAATLTADGTVTAAPARTADLTHTLAACTVTATGTVAAPGARTADLTQTLADATVAATGTVTALPARTGVLTQTLAACAVAAVGTIASTGVVAQTLGACTVAATGTVVALPARTADLSQTLANATSAATGTVVALPARTGVLTQTLAACTVLANGSVGATPGRDAALTQTLPNTTLAATVTLGRAVALGQTLANTTLSATGTVVALPARTAVLTQSLPSCTVAATGTVAPLAARSAALAQTLAPATLAATGTLGTRPMFVVPPTLPNPQSDVPYAQQLTVDGGGGPPVTFVMVSGTLPPGLSLSTGGLISGTPQTGATLMPETWPPGVVDTPYAQPHIIAETGLGVSYTFTVRATDGIGGTADQAYTLTLLSGWAGVTLWDVVPPSVLPGCLSCGGWTGVVSGMPMSVGTWAVTMRATNTAGSTRTRTYTLTVTS